MDQQLLEHYIDKHTQDALSFIEVLQIEEIIGLLESISTESAAVLLSQMDRFKAAGCLEKTKKEFAVKILEHLSLPNSEILLRLINSDYCNTLLDNLPDKISQNLRRIVSYPKNTVGAYLNPIVFAVSEELTIKQTLKRIKIEKPELQSYLYVIDRGQALVGCIELEKLITTNSKVYIRSIMNSSAPKVIATSTISSIADGESWIGTFSELAVVDVNGVFLGIISKDILTQLNPESVSIDQNLYKTGAALGELYKIGLASFLNINSENISRQNQ